MNTYMHHIIDSIFFLFMMMMRWMRLSSGTSSGSYCCCFLNLLRFLLRLFTHPCKFIFYLNLLPKCETDLSMGYKVQNNFLCLYNSGTREQKSILVVFLHAECALLSHIHTHCVIVYVSSDATLWMMGIFCGEMIKCR